MKKFFKFILVGLFFSGAIEFLGMGVASHDIAGFLPVILIVYPVYLTAVYFLAKVVDRLWKERHRADLAYFLIFGFVWLMLEWFAMGLAPWSDPAGDIGILVLGIIFQISMFFFGATISFAPRIFISDAPHDKKLQKIFLKFYIPFFIIAYGITILVPSEAAFPVAVILTIIAHLILGVFCIRHFKHLFYP